MPRAIYCALLFCTLTDCASAALVRWANSARYGAIEQSITGVPDFTTVGTASPPHAAGLAIDRVAGKIYWTHSGGIKRSDLDGKHTQTVLGNLGEARAIDVDHAGGYVYWSEIGVGVRRALLDGSQAETIATSGTVLGLALDTVHGKVYWSDTDADRIERADLDGSDREPVIVLTEGGLVGPMDIALDPYAGQVYWAEFGLGQIRAVNFNGSNMQTLYESTDGVGTPVGIGLDRSEGRLYWAQAGTGKVAMGATDGSGMAVAFEPGGQPGALVVEVAGDFNGDSFVTDADLAIWRDAFGTDAFSPVDTRADSDLNGISDGRDFLIWQRQLQTGPANVASQVPEPSAAFLALGLIALMGNSRCFNGGPLCTSRLRSPLVTS